MTDATPAPGAAADLLSGPATPAQQAMARIAELKNDAAYIKRHVNGDHETAAEFRRLHEIAFQPAPGSVISGAPTPEAQRIETAEHLSLTADLPPAVIEQIRQGQPVSLSEYRLAAGRRRALMDDPAFVARYMNNDAAARREMLLLNVIVSSRVSMEAAQ